MSKRPSKVYKYRAWLLNSDGEPLNGVEEQFWTNATSAETQVAQAYQRAAKALTPNLIDREAIWVETVHESTLAEVAP